jgi:hypothetical protein
MANDLSRVTERPAKHFSRVVFQQGRVQVEADLNEQQGIVEHRTTTTAEDVIGATGTPKAGGISIGVTADGADLSISPGRTYVDGILVELATTDVDAKLVQSNQVQASTWWVDGRPFDAGQYVTVSTGGNAPQDLVVTAVDESSRILTLSDAVAGFVQDAAATVRRSVTVGWEQDCYEPLPPLTPGRYRLYLDVWEQELTWIQDPEIREIALGGPDTAGRTRVRARVRLERIGDAGSGSCADAFKPDWTTKLPKTSGMMRARVDPGGGSNGPCVLPPTAGFRGLENQLYRVQIHGSGQPGDAGLTFKWQRDNASIAAAIEAPVQGPLAPVPDIGRDDVLGFHQGDLIEPSDDRSELSGTTYPLQTIAQVVQTTRQIKANSDLPDVDPRLHAKLQRWDGEQALTADEWHELELGLQVSFSAGDYQSGDYWLIPARTATAIDPGTIEWDFADDGTSLSRRSDGVEHHHAPLALVDYDGTKFDTTTLLDCRAKFPPLTAIAASDVSFDDSTCKLAGVGTVQQALDALCQRQGGGVCTLSPAPGAGWEQVFDAIADGQDARVCLQVGSYPLAATKLVTGKGNITLVGAGAGTTIDASTVEAALVFQNCASVEVRDLTAASGAGGAKGLAGTLTFIDCPTVDVEDVRVSCGAATFRTASCLAIRQSAPTAGTFRSARVRRCDLTPGHQQVGILLVNLDRVSVEDCVIRAGAALPGGPNLLNDKIFVSNLRRLLVSGATISPPAPPAPAPDIAVARPLAAARMFRNTLISAGSVSIAFRGERQLATAWQPVIDKLNPAVSSPTELLATVKQAAHTLLVDEAFRAQHPAFNEWLGTVIAAVPASLGQGIVVGGSAPTEVRIVRNAVRSCLVGIHVGSSTAGPRQAPKSSAGAVLIDGNTVDVLLTPDGQRARHGIFVGNCDSLVIDRNYLTLYRTAQAIWPVDGVRAWGILGRFACMRENHVTNFSTGINVRALGGSGRGGQPLWLVADNMLAGAATGVSASAGVQAVNNIS